jgi:8-oxo-dGTP pyrophosphatase MutT (NUDIX family)
VPASADTDRPATTPLRPSFAAAAERLSRSLADLRPRSLKAPVLRAAAVLVPLLNRPGGPTLLLTRRRDDLQDHAGQVAFPGGRLDRGEDAVAAALREAEEEVDLPRDRVRVLGRLDDQPSPFRFRVTPVVGLVESPPPLSPQPGEVDEIFEVPAAALMQPGRLRSEWWSVDRLPASAPRDLLLSHGDGYAEADRQSRSYRVYFFDVGLGEQRVVWGLTGRIVLDLLQRAFGFTPPGPPATSR